MPRQTRLLHGDDEYLFVDSPGDEAGPSLLILARADNPRAVAPGRTPTHQSELGQWCPVARFDGTTLALAPDPPEGLGGRLKEMLARYLDAERQRIARATNSCWAIVQEDGRYAYSLHPAQPSGLLLRLYREESRARDAADRGERVAATGDLREFLELRAEEGFAGALLDDREVIFFFLDEQSRIHFVKLRVEAGQKEVDSQLLDERGRWQPYEGDEALDAMVDTDAWDRLMRRRLGAIPYLGYDATGLHCFAFQRDRDLVTTADPDGLEGERIVPLFHDRDAAETYREREHLGRAALQPVDDLPGLLRRAAELGVVARLQPGDHRARGGALWCDDDGVLLDAFSGLWRARDGRKFAPIEE